MAKVKQEEQKSEKQNKKTISFVIPCYNSADYMDRCIESILGGGSDFEIIIVDDGSTDATPEKADRWAQRFPAAIRVIHQENGGHGGAVMAGVRAANGEYLMVVDSDDWIDRTARGVLLAKLRTFINTKADIDLVVCNYVYEHVLSGSRKVIKYRGALPMNRAIGWSEIGKFGIGQYITMHSAVYRTKVLRESGMNMPLHTFYVDNIFVYVPLPFVKKLYYLPVNLYRYFIGREDQSVAEAVILKRLDQQMRVTNELVDAYVLPDEVPNAKLAKYMYNYLMIIVTASSIFCTIKGDEEALELRRQMWRDIEAHSPKMAAQLRKYPLVRGSNMESKVGSAIATQIYRLAQRIYHFN